MDVKGGAVEASWILRTFDGRGISDCRCSEPAIARVRFLVIPVAADGARGDDVCAGRGACEFACQRETGATPLDIPPGKYAISLTALDASGRDLTQASGGVPASVRVPAPILRDVVFGQPAQLDALQIQACCAVSCDGQDRTKVCTRN